MAKAGSQVPAGASTGVTPGGATRAPQLTGLVLAGGRSSRLQTPAASDIDKGLVLFQGQALIAHACRFLQGQGVASILISANRNTSQYGQYGHVVSDAPEFGSFPGPLAGMLAAMEALRTPWLLVMPVDVVDLPADLAVRLLRCAAGQRPVYARSADGPHPLCVLLPGALEHDLRAWLATGGRKVQDWLAHTGAVAVDFAGAGFVNLNAPEDWLRAGASPP